MPELANPQWKTIASSVAGTSHIGRRMPCQDFGEARNLPGIVLIAVADGAGSALHASEAARCAGYTALDFLESQVTQIETAKDETVWRDLMHALVDLCRQNLLRLANSGGDEFSDNLDQYATTLLVVAITSAVVVTAQIGDGAVVGQFEDGRLEVFSRPQQREYANEVTFLTSRNYADELNIAILPSDDLDSLAVMTDGVDFLGIRRSVNLAHPGFFSPVFQFAKSERGTDENLTRYLESEAVCHRSDDDKTLVLATRI